MDAAALPPEMPLLLAHKFQIEVVQELYYKVTLLAHPCIWRHHYLNSQSGELLLEKYGA
jgi:hypothetical protein